MSASAPQLDSSASPGAGLALVLPGRRMPMSYGLSWVKRGMRFFMQAPLMWFVAVLFFFLFGIILSLLPIAGSIIVQVITPVFTAGFMVACRSLETGGDFEIEQLFAGFKVRFGKLAVVGLIFVALAAAIFLVFLLLAGFSIIGAIMSGQTNSDELQALLMASFIPIVLGLLVMAALFIPLVAAYWFAPMLVVMHDMAPVAAMKASFGACLRNFVPYLLYGIVMLGAAVVALLPAVVPILGWAVTGIAFVVLYAIHTAAAYAAYRDIFTDEAPAAPPARAF